MTTDGTTSYTYTPSGDLLGTKQGAAASLALTDLHTDLTALINPATGAVNGSRAYSPFGEITNTGGTQTALGYQHQYTDPTSGNTNMGARWYDPQTGGFTSRDTIALDPRDQLNANRYAYGASNPLINTDPTGHCLPVCAVPIVWGIAEGVAALSALAGGLWVADKASDAINQARNRVGNVNTAAQIISVYGTVSQINEALQLRARGRVGNVRLPNTKPQCGVACKPKPGQPPRGPGGGGGSPSDAILKAILKAAAEAARQAENERRANTAVAPPPLTDSLAPGVQKQLDEADRQPPIVINPGTTTAPDRPYQPDVVVPVQAPAGFDPESGDYEVFYRAMSNEEFASFAARGIYPRNGESFVTKELGYIRDRIPQSKAGAYDVLVTIYTQAGTEQLLRDNGGRDDPPSRELLRRGLGYLPVLQKGNVNQVHVKTEADEYLTYGLRGKGTGSSMLFNSQIVYYTVGGMP
ncbi:RHS repeat-associated core domain-containing protein [Amycolatopsis tucumanensis]|nr:RHS repeat-associated core domain-containing protein [Amycolatopsis tucumanensis]